MNERKICEVLRIANAGPAVFLRDDFFAVKEHLLKHFATSLGPCWQHITKRCWGSYGRSCDGSKSCSCCGTGLYSDLFVVHEGFEWNGAKFLVPRRRVPARTSQVPAGHEVPYPLLREPNIASYDASIALVEAFTEQVFDNGDRYAVSRMRVAMGQIPRRLLIGFPEDIPF